MFITFEGIDYSGKSTQIQLLADRLQREGRETIVLREPGGTPVSEAIRALLLDRKHLGMTEWSELFLFSAARAQLVREVVRPALAAHRVVLCDRFYDSSTAYQGYGRGLDLDHVRRINSIATGGLAPDLTFIVELSVEESVRRRLLARGSADRMESSGEEFYRRVADGYRTIAAAEPKRCILVDGTGTREALHEQIWAIVSERAHNRSHA